MRGAQALLLKKEKNMEITIQDICQFATAKVRAAKDQEFRQKYGSKTIVLFRVGACYVSYDQSAIDLSRECGITLYDYSGTSKVDFPSRQLDWVLPRMIRQGFRIAILDE